MRRGAVHRITSGWRSLVLYGPGRDAGETARTSIRGASNKSLSSEQSPTSSEPPPTPWADADGARSKEANWAEERGQEEEEDENAYLHGWDLAILMLLLMVGQFFVSVDATILSMLHLQTLAISSANDPRATALPRITAEFHSLQDVGWYGSIYLLMITGTQPMWGKIFSHFNIRLTFLVATLVLNTGSVVCAVAQNTSILICGRAIVGFARSAMLAGGTLTVAYQVPLEKRPLYFAILQSMDGLGCVCGPPLGGLFTDSYLTWRFCFWINVPVGALQLIVGFIYFTEPRRAPSLLPLRQKLIALDIPGAILLTGSLLCLFTTLEYGGTTYAWSDSRSWGWLIGFGGGLTAFAVLQNRLGDKASIPTRLVSNRNVAFNCLYTGLIWTGFGIHTYFLPFYFQSAKNATAEQSGLYVVPYLAAMMAVSIVVGAILNATGALTICMLFGGVVFTIGSGLLTTLQRSSPTAAWAGFQLLAGTGMGSSVQLSLVGIQAAVATDDLGVANGIWLLSTFAGGAIGVAVADTIFLNILERQLASLPQLDPAAIVAAGADGFSMFVPQALIPEVQQAYNVAISRCFILAVTAAALGTLCLVAMRPIHLKK